MKSEVKNCQNCKKDFTIEPEDFLFYEKIKVPPPTFCYLCRAQRRMAWRNENTLFKRKSDFSGKDIFSGFSSASPVKVYEKDVWLSDKWDPMDYAMDYDFNKTFFEQFNILLHTVPLKNLNVVGGVNSDYCNNITDPKDSYMCFNGKSAENCLYCNGLTYLKDCVDTSHCGKSENCYESFWLTSCNNAFFSSHCESSFNLYFSSDCIGCHDCFGCVGLRNKEYHIYNIPYSKEEYRTKLSSAEFDLSSYQNLQNLNAKTSEFWKKFPKKYMIGYNNTNVSGNYISHSKNTHCSNLIREGENIKYCQYLQELPGCKDCYDYTAWGDSAQMLYECSACGISASNVRFCYNVQENVHDIEYSYMCSGSSYLFGCIGLRKKQYCVFNKQYSENEYFDLVKKIKQQMLETPFISKNGIVYKYGEFFPSEFSPFAYNETLAFEYFPLTKDLITEDGFVWRDSLDRNYAATLSSQDIPDNIKDVQENITDQVIACSHNGECADRCTTAFRVTEKELMFYRRHGLPLPRLCPKCRNDIRLKQRTNLQTKKVQCSCDGLKSKNGVYENVVKHSHGETACSNIFDTSYLNDNEIIYCEKCYQQEVY